MKTNKKTPVKRVNSAVRLAGGMGAPAAIQSAEQDLTRLVMTCLLWEDIAYASGVDVAKEICETIPKVSGQFAHDVAVSARVDQKLRHVPLLIIREMCRYESHRKFVRSAIAKVCTRPDQLTELVSIYWKDSKTLPKQMKLGISDALNSYDEYSLSKWNRDADVKLRDVLFLSHSKPKDQERVRLFKALTDNTLATPETWEVKLSACKTEDAKREVWLSLINKNKLGALAVLRNLRNMQAVKVPKADIRKAIKQCSPSMLLPIDFIKAGDYAADFLPDLEELMFRCLSQFPRLSGETLFVLDVSGSMNSRISSKSEYSRIEVGAAMAMMAKEVCGGATIYLTAGSDGSRGHKTSKVNNLRGFGLVNEIRRMTPSMGGGGIFTRQCLDYLREKEEVPDRIIIFSDSQDCDYFYGNKTLPSPFGKKNYIIDVNAHKNGVNYKGVWTAEISGWSENFLRFIHQFESLN